MSMERIARLFLLLWLCVFASFNAHAVDPFLDWKTAETENFIIHFAAEHKATAERVAAIAEQVHLRLSKELNWTPEDKTHLVVSDESDLANGYATPIHFNRSVLFMTPPSGLGSLEDFDDWLTLLITHEYTHVLHLDKADRSPEMLRNVFGRFLLLFPNLLEPAWIIEGLATHKETDMGRGIGRGQSSLFAMMMREETRAGIKPVSQVNLPITTWPSGTTRYLYGVYFMRFISENYGEEKIQEFVEAYSGNLLPFAVNSTFRNIFGKDVYELWDEFDAWLKQRFNQQIDEINARGLKVGTQLTDEGYLSGPVRVSGNNAYYVRNAGYHQSELVRFNIDEGIESREALTEVHFGTDFRVHREAGILMAQLEICEEYSLYRDLYLYDEVEDELTRITECDRYIRALWAPDGKSIIALHHEAGEFELHRLNPEGEVVETLWVSKDDEIISQMDVSPDGENLVVTIWRRQQGWNLALFNLQNKQWTPITENTDIKGFPVYSGDGSSILYTADYDGVYNLYRYNINEKRHEKITNVESGVFQAVESDEDNSIYYVGYSAKGSDIFKLDDVQSTKVVEPDKGEKHKTYDYQLATLHQEDYSPWPSLRPRWWFPELLLDEDSTEIGFITAGNDALGAHNYSLTLSYETKNEIPLGSFFYSYAGRLIFALSRTNNIFTDSNGDFNRARPTNAALVALNLPVTRLLSRHNFLIAALWERDFDHTLALGATPAPDFEDNILGLAWLYNSSRRYPLSISENDGMNLRVVAEDSDSFNSDFTGQVYTLDWRQFVRTGKESVFAFRLVQGYGTDSPSQFRLGGEDNDIGISIFGQTGGAAVFGDRDYALRGYKEGLPQLSGRRAQLASAEWRFPFGRPERGFMAPPVGLMQWSGTLFVDSGAAYTQDSPDEYFTGAGFEINADLNVFYWVPVRARLGYAHGFDEIIGDDRVYLQVGASF